MASEPWRSRFFVRGLPVPQGSTRAFIVKGRPIITSTSKGLKDWRTIIALEGQNHAPPMPWGGPIGVQAKFFMPRPQSEPKRKETMPDRRPDIDKLARAVLDALKGVFYHDDAQVVSLNLGKDWADNPFTADRLRCPPGVDIYVGRILLGEEGAKAGWDLLLPGHDGGWIYGAGKDG